MGEVFFFWGFFRKRLNETRKRFEQRARRLRFIKQLTNGFSLGSRVPFFSQFVVHFIAESLSFSAYESDMVT